MDTDVTPPSRPSGSASSRADGEGDWAHDLATPEGRRALDGRVKRRTEEWNRLRREGRLPPETASPGRGTELFDHPGFRDLPEHRSADIDVDGFMAARDAKTSTAKLPEPDLPPHRLYGDSKMDVGELRKLAKNPRVKTEPKPGRIDEQYLGTLERKHYRDDFQAATKTWLDTPRATREAFDREVREAIDEAAAMGDKWARRLQQDINNGKINYIYEPGLESKGLAPGDGVILVNPLKSSGKKLSSGDEVASYLLHEYVHSYRGPEKWVASEGRRFAGVAEKGEYNEIRAFWAEAQFNRSLQKARNLNGKDFDDTVFKELNALLGAGSPGKKPAARTSRGLAARRNLQGDLVDGMEYGRAYERSRSAGAKHLSAYKGGSMKNIREELRKARGTPEYEKLLERIRREGGRTRPRDVDRAPLPEDLKPPPPPPAALP